MRPRQTCLGILRTIRRAHEIRNNFNEAEASLPRNTGSSFMVPTPGEVRFNEAEASLPRNTVNVMPSPDIQRLSFNEAEASLPRNTTAEQKIQCPRFRLQ